MFSAQITDIILISLLALVLILLVIVVWLNFRIKRMLKGVGVKNIEEAILNINQQLEDFEDFQIGSEKYLTTVEERLRKSVQAVETVRFNPFKGTGTGGNQSFAMTLLNEEGDGVVLSSLYSSDRVSLFAKPLEAFKSSYELSGEEKDTLDKAKNAVKKG